MGRTMVELNCVGTTSLASLEDGSTAAGLIPELARHGVWMLIELEAPAFVAAAWQERPEMQPGSCSLNWMIRPSC